MRRYAPVEIWLADWIFYEKRGRNKYTKEPVIGEVTVKDVITRRIPKRFLIKENTSYSNALRDVIGEEKKKKFIEEKDGTKKFKVKYKRKIGIVNGSSMERIS